MEEKSKTKEIKMGSTSSEAQQKYTYEELNEICDKLFKENQYFRQQHQRQMDALNTINRLDYLLKIVEIEGRGKGEMFSSDFIVRCTEEIEKIMTPLTEEEKEDSKEN